jgi:hypothetical protein
MPTGIELMQTLRHGQLEIAAIGHGAVAACEMAWPNEEPRGEPTESRERSLSVPPYLCQVAAHRLAARFEDRLEP